MMRLNHLGEHIAVNIYAAQIKVCCFTAPALVPQLREFLAHEQRHLHIFSAILRARDWRRCHAFAFLGGAGFLLGFCTALLGRVGVMACTAAVESVVLEHLDEQLEHLRVTNDVAAVISIRSILDEEMQHREVGMTERDSRLYASIYALVAPATAWVIALGQRL